MLEKRKTASEWHAELRLEGRRLTLAEAKALAQFDATALLRQLHQDVCEIKHRLQVLDLHLERTVEGYRHPDDMRALKEGAA